MWYPLLTVLLVIGVGIDGLDDHTGRYYRQVVFPSQSSRCTDSSGAAGTCVNINKCPTLLNLLLTSPSDSNTVELLRRSACGYEGRDPKVCCPTAATTKVTPVTKATPASRTTTTKAPATPQCGRGNFTRARITAGQPAELGAWPWIAALGYRTPSRPGPDFRCGGSLVSNRYVVTASHCIIGIGNYELYLIRLGDLDLNDSVNDGANPLDITVERITTHPQYVASPVTNDIALVKLSTAVEFTAYIQPICLPTSAELRSDPLTNRSPFIVGWGATGWRAPSVTHLQEAQVPVRDMKTCQESYKNEHGALIDERVICAGKGTQDACQGDSGGPLMLPNVTTFQFYLIGVVSFGVRCAEPNFPGVYTRVTAFVDWVQQNMT